MRTIATILARVLANVGDRNCLTTLVDEIVITATEMKVLMTLWLVLGFTWWQFNCRASEPNDSRTATDVRVQIDSLRRFIVPPRGTNKADIDAVFGTPKQIEKLDGKGSAVRYPMHVYQLLPPRMGLEFRAILHITYKDEKVRYVGISHEGVTVGRVGEPKPEEIARENRLLLTDLREIVRKFASKLRNAPWSE